MSNEQILREALGRVKRPIVGIERRTAEEVFTMMCARLDQALAATGDAFIAVPRLD